MALNWILQLKAMCFFPPGKRLQLPSAVGVGGGNAAQVFRCSEPSQAVWWGHQTLPAAAPALGLQRRGAGLSSNLWTLYVDWYHWMWCKWDKKEPVGNNLSVIFIAASSAAEERRESSEQRLCDCYTSCAATMLGLSSITPDQLLDLVKASSDVPLT